MEGKEAIIKKIIDDAELKAKSIVDEANNGANGRKDIANAWADKYKDAQTELLKKECDEIVSRRLTVADLDVRKLVLEVKQEVVTEVIGLLLKELCNMDKNVQLRFIENLIKDSCDEGDEIVLPKNGLLTEGDILSLQIVKNKKLTVSKEKGDFIGGVMLIGKICDKDLSYAAFLKSNDKLTSDIAEILF